MPSALSQYLAKVAADSYRLPKPVKKAEEFIRNPKDKSKQVAKGLPPKAEDLVQTDSLRARLADYFAENSWGGERAGRTQAMANAIGENTTFEVKHPILSSLLYGGVGSALGAGAGGSLGLLISSPENNYNPALGGAGLGSVLGGLVGKSLAAKVRRNEMKRINHFYDQDREAGKLDPKTPELSALSALLLPFRGPHRSGQVEAVRAMRGEKNLSDQRGVLRDPLYVAEHFVPGVPFLHGYGQNLKTQLAADYDRERDK